MFSPIYAVLTEANDVVFFTINRYNTISMLSIKIVFWPSPVKSNDGAPRLFMKN